jgi:peptidoglycan pentaglycine glycine transferase (the first glycine)
MINAEEWNQIVSSFPITHVLQTWQWGLVKQQFGWEMLHRVWKDKDDLIGAALILKRKITLPLIGDWGSLLYVPKGPLLKSWEDRALVQQVLQNLELLAREEKAVLIKIDPDVVYAVGEEGDDWVKNDPSGQRINPASVSQNGLDCGKQLVSMLKARGWIFSREQVQFRNTVVLNLELAEDELLRRMKQKTRYNIRLAERKGILVREGSSNDLPLLYQLYRETSQRDGFIIRNEDYYLTAWQTFLNYRQSGLMEGRNGCELTGSALLKNPFAQILIAEYEGEAVAALVLFVFRDKAWYLYGMSTDKHREKMPNYLLHWRAIQYLRQIGVRAYDLWGAPDCFDESDPMFGVYRFKIGFGGETIQHIGAWDYAVSPLKYRLYQEILPKYLGYLRMQRRMNS